MDIKNLTKQDSVMSKDLKDLTQDDIKKRIPIMIAIVIFILVIGGFLLLLLTAVFSPSPKDDYAIPQQQTVTPNKQSEKSAKENDILPASPKLKENIKFVLNKGYSVVDENKIYYTKSKDFQKAYFIGTLVQSYGQIYNCIWFSNSENMEGDTMAANDYAVEASSMPDARKSKLQITANDDGYSRINQQLLIDWNK